MPHLLLLAPLAQQGLRVLGLMAPLARLVLLELALRVRQALLERRHIIGLPLPRLLGKPSLRFLILSGWLRFMLMVCC